MTTPFDPYKAPQASLDGPAPADPSATVPDAVVQLLAQTRPWVRLVAILFFVFLGLMVLGLVVAVALVGSTGRGGMLSAATFIPLAVAMLLYVPPTLYLWQYAGNIGRLQSGGGMRSLEQALASQKSFWKYVAILAVVMVLLYLLAFVGGGLFGALLKSGR